MKPLLAAVASAVIAVASALPGAVLQNYAAAERGGVVELRDARADTTVSIVPSVGNVAFDMKVKGAPVLWFPSGSVDEFRKTPRFSGIPFLAPWANRLDEQGFYANGKHYSFNMELGNVRGAHPIHGFLAYTPRWRVVEVKSDASRAWVTSRLEFFREPSWMAQFPFAHTIDMTYRLEEGVLEVATRIENLSVEPMPVAVGYHPYFQLTDAPRSDWTIAIGARTEWVLSPEKLPTGETRPITGLVPDPAKIPLRDLELDHVFGDLVRDESGRAVMSVKGRSQQIDVLFGQAYRAAVIYAPLPRPSAGGAAQRPGFICFEPMAGITNALNLAHRGLYKELQSIPPGGVWQESFWVRPRGF